MQVHRTTFQWTTGDWWLVTVRVHARRVRTCVLACVLQTLAKLASFKNMFGEKAKREAKREEHDRFAGTSHDGVDAADADAERLRVAAADDLEAERGISWRSLVRDGGGLKFEKSIEEKRAEISRDDDYKVLDPLAEAGFGGEVDLRKSQHRRRLQGDHSDHGRGGRVKEKW